MYEPFISFCHEWYSIVQIYARVCLSIYVLVDIGAISKKVSVNDHVKAKWPCACECVYAGMCACMHVFMYIHRVVTQRLPLLTRNTYNTSLFYYKILPILHWEWASTLLHYIYPNFFRMKEKNEGVTTLSLYLGSPTLNLWGHHSPSVLTSMSSWLKLFFSKIKSVPLSLSKAFCELT